MSITIKGMEMPTNKFGRLLLIYPNGEVVSGEDTKFEAIPVPAHGRLIDADALLKGCERATTEFATREFAFSQTAIENAPTIIEAEDDET